MPKTKAAKKPRGRPPRKKSEVAKKPGRPPAFGSDDNDALLQIYLPRKVKDSLKMLAASRGTDMSALLRPVLKDIARKKPKGLIEVTEKK